MTDLEARLEDARPFARLEWTSLRHAALEQALDRRKRRRFVLRAGAAGAGLLGAAVASLLLATPRQELTPPAASPPIALVPAAPAGDPGAAPEPVPLRDGSTVLPLDAETRVRTLADSDREVAIELLVGKARFDVVKNLTRAFRVVAASVTIHVLGTRFTTQRSSAGVGVWVHEGRVRVEAPDGRQLLLDAGQTQWFPPAYPPAVAAEPPTRVGTPAPRRPAAHENASGADLAPPASPRDEVADLLLAADFARAAERPAEAVEPLARIVGDHGGDARSPLAAFTLGRLLLDLGRPAEAALAFGKTREFDPNGPLAEDALAREVEAWARAGDTQRATKRARHYLTLHPSGRRAPGVRAWGGIP